MAIVRQSPLGDDSPEVLKLVADVSWPRSIRVGGTYWSTSIRVWWRFAARLFKAALATFDLDPLVYSYLGDPLASGETAIVAGVCNRSRSQLTVAEYSSVGPVLKLIDRDTVKGCVDARPVFRIVRCGFEKTVPRSIFSRSTDSRRRMGCRC